METLVYTVNDVNVVKSDEPGHVHRHGPELHPDARCAHLQPEHDHLACDAPARRSRLQHGDEAVHRPVQRSQRHLHGRGLRRHRQSQAARTPSRRRLRHRGDLHGHRQRASRSRSTRSGNNQMSVGFPYTNQFFVDVVNGLYLLRRRDDQEGHRHLVRPRDHAVRLHGRGRKHVPHPLQRRRRRLPGCLGCQRDRRAWRRSARTPSASTSTRSQPESGAPGIPMNVNSFQVNGNLYTITGTPAGSNYSACQVVGDAITPKNFTSANTFVAHRPDHHLHAAARRGDEPPDRGHGDLPGQAEPAT